MKFSDKQVIEIQELHKNGSSINDIMDKYQLNYSTTYYLLKDRKVKSTENLLKVSKNINTLDSMNNRKKGIEYHAAINLLKDNHISLDNAHVLTLPGYSHLEFEQYLINIWPNIAQFHLIEKEDKVWEELKEDHRINSDKNEFKNKLTIWKGNVLNYLKLGYKFKFIWLDLQGMSCEPLLPLLNNSLENNSVFMITESWRGYTEEKEELQNKYRFKPNHHFIQKDILYRTSLKYHPGMEHRQFLYNK